MRAQVHVAADQYEQHFGRRPPGIWLGECGYVPGRGRPAAGGRDPRTSSSTPTRMLHADGSPVYGVHAPVYCPSGVAAFARDPETSEQVWSAEDGYPGDPHYRDFYRDIGFDLPLDYIGPYIHPEGHRRGHRLQVPRDHRTTSCTTSGSTIPRRARSTAGDHAAHFRERLRAAASSIWPSGMDRPPMVLSPYDAELFGHWWFEGPIFLEVPLPPAALRPGDRSTPSRRATTSSAIRPTRWRRPAPRRGERAATTSSGSTKPTPGSTPTCTTPRSGWSELARRFPAPSDLRAARPQPGGARADAGPEQRLGVHHVHGNDGSLRRAAHQRPHPPLQPALRGSLHRPRRRGLARATSRRRTTSFPTSTIGCTRREAREPMAWSTGSHEGPLRRLGVRPSPRPAVWPTWSARFPRPCIAAASTSRWSCRSTRASTGTSSSASTGRSRFRWEARPSAARCAWDALGTARSRSTSSSTSTTSIAPRSTGAR